MKGIDIVSHKEVDVESVSSFGSGDVIISIPHSGTCILQPFDKKFDVCRDLIADTDLFTDKVYAGINGSYIVTSLTPYFVNMNRARSGEVDALHTKPLLGKPVLLEDYTESEREEVLVHYDLYHSQIQEAVTSMKERLGYALMFDCHSMGSVGLSGAVDPGEERADVCIGTRDGTSASSEVIELFVGKLSELFLANGLTVSLNEPYKGGYITQTYGKPSENIHVIQIELRKGMYMDEETFEMQTDKLEAVNLLLKEAIEYVAKSVRQEKNKS